MSFVTMQTGYESLTRPLRHESDNLRTVKITRRGKET